MNDERLIKEMNNVKGKVLIYVIIATIVSLIFKLLTNINILSYSFEGYILIIGLILYLTIENKKTDQIDERVELEIGKTYNKFFYIIAIGSFIIHFVVNYIIASFDMNSMFNLLSFLILLGFIITLIYLRKNNLYANYKYIEESNKKYYSNIITNIFLLFLFFLFIAFIIFILHFFLPKESTAYLMINISILISWISLSIDYLLFSIFEKNHYNESILIENYNPVIITKNAFFFYIPIYISSVLSAIANFLYTISALNNDTNMYFYILALLNAFFRIYAFNVIVFILIFYLLIYHYYKKIINNRKILKWFLVYIWVSFALGIISYLYSIFLLFTSAIVTLQSFETIQLLHQIYNYYGLGITLFNLAFSIVVIYYLFKYNIKGKILYLIYVAFPLISRFSILIIYELFENIYSYQKSLMVLNIILALIPGALFLIFLYINGKTHIKYQQKKTIFAIGGGELKDLETLDIDKEIVKSAHKTNPKVLFIPTASMDAPLYIESFNHVYGELLNCEVSSLLLVNSQISDEEIKDKIFNSDIIYVGGGDTKKMLDIWKEHNVDKYLIEAYNKNIILSGLSAGSMCWFKYGFSDTDFLDELGIVEGLGLINMVHCPHLDEDNNLEDFTKIMGKFDIYGLGIENNCAVKFVEGKPTIIKSRTDKSAYLFINSNGKVVKVDYN